LKLVVLKFEDYTLYWWNKYQKDILEGKKKPFITTWFDLKNALR